MVKKKTKRSSPVDYRKAQVITIRMFYIGCAMVLAGVIIGNLMEALVLVWLSILPGMAIAGLGYYLHNRWVICPHCGAFLGEDSRMVRKVPECCPKCREEL